MKKSAESMANYLDVLNEEQRAAVEHEGSPLLILAGAGSGKTRVITTKIAYLIAERHVEPWSILAVTFTKKAANEMKERAVKLEPRAEDSQIRTFHSFGSWFLRKYAEAAGLSPSFTVYDDDDSASLLMSAVHSLKRDDAKKIIKQIALAKDYCLSPDDDLSVISKTNDLNQFYYEYQRRLQATGNVDFGDLIRLPTLVMEKNPDIASFIHNRFRVIMVDEYQDTNIAQYQLLKKLAGMEEENPAYVCVVGDDDQSIYHFRGAEVGHILSFPNEFANTQIIQLKRNYRSTSGILAAADMVVSKNESRFKKEIIADRGEGAKPVLVFIDNAGFYYSYDERIKKIQKQGRNNESVFVGNIILQSLKNGASFSDWAIFYRTNAQSRAFEKELSLLKIPYKMLASRRFFEREEIKDIIAYLSLFSNHKDEVSFRRIINKPTRGLGEKTQIKILDSAISYDESNNMIYSDLILSTEKIIPELSKKAKEGAEKVVNLFKDASNLYSQNNKLSDLIHFLSEKSGLYDYYKSGDEVEEEGRTLNLQDFEALAIEYPCSEEGLKEFIDNVLLDQSEKDKDLDDAVSLSTLHNTKGLEFNRVIITGVENGVFPQFGKTGADLEEERRLFYVGITRAKNELYVTSSNMRYMFRAGKAPELAKMEPSPFLREASSAFTILGNKPFGFEQKRASGPLTFGKSADTAFGGMGQSAYGASSELAEKWKKGTKLYHDDYGYGIISSAHANGAEYVIEVTFEGGGKKKFLPAYQAKALTIIKD